ncbi:hypothetical protein Q1695_013324 [Nippostrongylus brasiliensis]|nr:hypothetical protein Q1695_013324 [Nippostrongylus brasiliensis]
MSRLYTLLMWSVLSAVVLSVPFRIARPLPSSLVKRIAHELDTQDDVLVMLPRWRARRSQPIIDYTDEFSADPFEMPLNKGRRP